MRDFGFAEGIRIAGIHQWVTELHHIELNRQKANVGVDQTLSAITQMLYGYNLTIDLTDGSFTLITGTGTEEAIAIARAAKDYREIFDENMKRVRPDFRDRCRELCSLDFMRNNCDRAGHFGTVEYAVASKDGSERWEEVNVMFGLSAAGHPIANVLGRDVTEARRAVARHEQELKAAAAKDKLLSGITQTLYGFNVTVHLATGRYSLITGTGTERICAVFNAYRNGDYAKAIEVLLQHVADDYKAVARQLIGRDYLASLANRDGHVGSGSFPWTASDGTRHWVEINVFISTDEHGDPVANVLGRDITDDHARAETERKLIVAQQASAAKSKFLSTLSHDIRTPMNSILGMATIAQTHIKNHENRGETDSECIGHVGRCLDNVLIASRHMLGLINDILDLSRMESERLKLNEQPFSLDEIEEHVATIIRQQSDAKGISFNYHESNVIHRRFLGDAMRLNQIFINILGNSVKFTGSRGAIGWTIEERAGEREGEAKFVFTMSDNGRGMSKDFLPRLFEPFAQEGRQASDTYVGTGLGMSIVGQLVDLMGGRIDVKSELGQGTTFTIEIPIKLDAAFHEKRESVQEDSDRGMKLISQFRFLVVDDVHANSDVICEMISLAGGRSETADDGAKGFETFRDSKPGYFDCILMDVRMPVMNGYEATKAIRALDRPDAKTIPIIAMTADAFAENIEECKKAGMNAHVAKPVNIDLLLN